MSRRAVTPVIATIILIAATLVLALVVGAYTFGLFGSNVKTVTLTSATLYGGVSASATVVATSSLSIALNNPGSQSYITSLVLTGTGFATPVSNWDNTSAVSAAGNTITFTSASIQAAGCPSATWNNNVMCPGQVTTFTFYPEAAASVSVTTGQTFNYVINFQNGQSVSGSLIAQ
jgi:flagellin-like protein